MQLLETLWMRAAICLAFYAIPTLVLMDADNAYIYTYFIYLPVLFNHTKNINKVEHNVLILFIILILVYLIIISFMYVFPSHT